MILSLSETEDADLEKPTTRKIQTMSCDGLSFYSSNDVGLLNTPDSTVESEGIVKAIGITGIASSFAKRFSDILDKDRIINPASWTTSGLAVSGSRGVACIFTSNNMFQLFDMEVGYLLYEAMYEGLTCAIKIRRTRKKMTMAQNLRMNDSSERRVI